MSKPVLIWGAGAIGGVLGAYMIRSGRDVLLVDVNADHVATMNARGLTIEGPVDNFHVNTTAVMPDAVEGRFRTVFLCTKAQDTVAASRALLPCLSNDGVVVSAQNGLNELAIQAIIGSERAMGCFVNFGADWLEPGRILLGNRGKVAIGELDGTLSDRAREVCDLLRSFEPDAELTDNIWGYLWGKMGYGTMLFATALTPASMSDNFAAKKYLPVFIGLGREVMAVALRRGIRPLGFNGFDPEAFFPGADPMRGRMSVQAMAEFNRHTAKTHSGIWRDIAVRKRKTEVDSQVGVIVRLAEELRIPVPLSKRLLELVREVEDGRPQSWSVLDELSEAANPEMA